MTTCIPSITIPAFVFESPAASILLPVTLGSLIGWSTRPDRTQKTYRRLAQPPFSPPAAVFGPVWTLLYLGMGYAAHRAWTTGIKQVFDHDRVMAAKHGATLYTIQLGLNLVWMPLFFGFGRPIEATADLVALVGTTGYLTYVWSKVDTISAWLMVPYLGWLSFATYLSAGTGHLNNWKFSVTEEEKKEL